MVTALLRALGFDDEAEAPPGEGQDRAPVGVGQSVPEDVTQARQRTTREAAQPWLGTQYRLGGNDQRAVDCSGLVNALLRGFGANIPGRPSTTTYRDQLAAPIAWEAIQPGDVLISPANRADPVSGEHMALYVGGGQMVEASGTAGQVRYSGVTNRNLQPYRLREPVPGLQQATLLAQREGDLPQQPPPAANAGGATQPGGPPTSIQRIAMQAGADPELADIMAASALTESSGNPLARRQTAREDSVGLWQANRLGGVGAGQSVEALQDPQTNAQVVMPQFQAAYAAGQRQGLRGPDLAVYTHLHGERPADQTWNGDPATRMRANYAQVDAHSKQAEELQIGGGYAPPSGAPGQANAGGSPNLVQQAQQNLQALLQAAGGAIAGLGATTAHAAPEDQLPTSPGGAVTGAQAPLPMAPAPAGPPAMAPAGSPEAINRGMDAMLAPGAQTVGDAASAAGTAASAVGAAAGAVAAPFGRSVANIGTPSAAQRAAQAAPPPASPTNTSIPVVSGIGDAVGAAAQAYGSQLRPQGYGWPGRPGGAAGAGAPSTTPAAAIAETAPPTGTPGQGPDWGTTSVPTGPQSTPPPPDNAIPGRHWDPTVVDATTGQVVGDQVPEVPAYARNWQTPGQWVRMSERTPSMPANQPSALQYRPTVSGNYDFGAGPVFYDAQANTTSQPNAASQRQQGATVENYGNGLTVSRESATSPTGTATYVDPNGTILQAPWSQAGGFGTFQPAGGPTPGLSPNQQRESAQYQQTFEAQQAQNRFTNSLDQQRADQAAQDARDRVAASNRSFEQVTADTAARLAADQAHQRQVNSVPVVGADNNLYGADPTNPDPNAPLVNMGAATPTPVQQAQIEASRASTQVSQQESRLPRLVGHQIETPQYNPDTGDFTGYQSSPEGMSASEQALADERAHEFGTLSAYQQSQADQSKASLAQNESQFQQSQAERKSEADKPYQQMTKAEQARAGIDQQRLGLDTQRLGLDEAKAANQVEPLPRGGHIRIDPFTGQSSLINAPEPEDIRMVGSQIYIPGGRQVSMMGSQITGGPNPYAGVPTGGGGMFQYPGAQGGMGGQQASPYQNWGGQGGGGWGGQQGMSGSPGWQQPRQQQGWPGSGY